jgi:hypothetical protein
MGEAIEYREYMSVYTEQMSLETGTELRGALSGNLLQVLEFECGLVWKLKFSEGPVQRQPPYQ